ncbi:MAG: DUF3791 domain-containing protein [Clostridia bacterium]|nr:DUF3791 domain-containing protein [Clostridia bacterium]
MSEEMKFFLFLIERYAQHKEKSTGEVMNEWDARGITQKIFDGYWEYHTARIENAFADIDSLLSTGKHAW